MLADIAGEFHFSLQELGQLTHREIWAWWGQAARRNITVVAAGLVDTSK